MLYDDGIARISITKETTFEELSYAVVAQPRPVAFTVEDDASIIRLKTAAFTLHIQKNPVRFCFTDLTGVVINEDDPAFGTSWLDSQVTTYKKLQIGERFIGLGEKTGPLDRRGHGYVNWNTDNYAYGIMSDPLYCSVPFYIGIHHQLAYGIFFDNTHKTYFNFGASNNRFSSFSADAGEMNYYFLYAPSVAEIIMQYTFLTGRMELPPRWSLGYQQCRYSYYPDKEVLSIAQTFRDKDIPADAIVLDIHYMDNYKIFTWSKNNFPDPGSLIGKLHQLNFKLVVICDPGIKVERGYHAYEDGMKHDVFIKYPDGSPYTGEVWPGWCHFPDFTRPQTRHWWKQQLRFYTDMGIDGFWNDMNEIATWGNMLPENIELDFEGNRDSMRRGRNIYGLQMARCTYEAAKDLVNKRPFNLTRSGFAGVQRYAAVWTGDNVASDDHMMLGVRLINSMGLSGIAFAGYDVGGFVGDASSRLFARWISIGAFSPFFRGHSMINSRDSEPWSYGEEVEQISRNYIRFRYRLLPYLYSLFYETTVSGMPVQRSLAIDYTHDPRIYESQYQHEYLFGPYLLVAPVESFRDYANVYLPGNTHWYYLYDGKKLSGNTAILVDCPLHRLPVFVKAGAILPMQPVRSSTAEKCDTLAIHLYKGEEDTSFVFYEDDGITFQYREHHFARRTIEYRARERELVLHPTEGNYKSEYTNLEIVFHGFEDEVSDVTLNGNNLLTFRETNRFFQGLEKYDPIRDPEPAPEEPVISVRCRYGSNEMVFQW